MSALAPQMTLSQATNGALPYETIRDLFLAPDAGEVITRFLGCKIQDSPRQPMFTDKGEPLLDRAGRQICWPWAEAELLTKKIIETAGCQDATSVPEVAHLPLPLFSPIDVVMVTADGHVVMSLRSAEVENSANTAFASAAGSPAETDGLGTHGFAVRALHEQLSLDWAEVIVDSCDDFSVITNRTLGTHNVKATPVGGGDVVTLKGYQAAVGRTVVARTKQTLELLESMIQLHPKYAAIFAVPVDQMQALRDLGERHEQGVPVLFYKADDERRLSLPPVDIKMTLQNISSNKPDIMDVADRLSVMQRILDAVAKVGFQTTPKPSGGLKHNSGSGVDPRL